MNGFSAQILPNGEAGFQMSGVQYLDETQDYAEKEAAYLRVRREEQRLLPDAQVARLPRVPMGSQHVREWAIRAHSLGRFFNYAKKKFQTARILEFRLRKRLDERSFSRPAGGVCDRHGSQ